MGDLPPLRVGLLGQFGIGNLGNEGSLEAVLAFVRRAAPGAEITCITSDPDFVRRIYGINAIQIRNSYIGKLDRLLFRAPQNLREMRRAARQTRDLDVLIVPGTGVLDDFNEPPLGLPFDIWRWTRAAHRNSAKVAFVSVGAGPVTHWLSRRFVIGAARAATYRSYRDKPSDAFMRSIAASLPGDHVFPDVAFSLHAPAHGSSASIGAPVVAVGVMAYYGWSGSAEAGAAVYNTYTDKIAAFVAWLADTGRRVRFTIGKDKDVKTVEDVRAKAVALSPRVADALEPFEAAQNLHDVMAQMASCDIAVVTRFHNLVCALQAHKPTVSLGYAKKNQALLEEMGLGAYSQDVETFDLATLKEHTEAVLANRAALATPIASTVKRYAAELEDQWRLLTPLLTRKPS